MSPISKNKTHTSRSSLFLSAPMTENCCQCNSIDEAASLSLSKANCRPLVQDNHLSNYVVFIISLNDCNKVESRKKFSVDIQLLSYTFLIRLINRTFNLYSNFTLIAKNSSSLKCNFLVTDDFDVDGSIMSKFDEHDNNDNKQQNTVEFIVYKYPRTKSEIDGDSDEWCILESDQINSNDKEDMFELIQIKDDCILVTVKNKNIQQETFLQKATSWLHGSVNSSSNNCLTKKEFSQMFDPSTGRLLDESTFRQRVFEGGCEESIRKTVWCYLLRVYNETMTNEDKNEYQIKVKERYDEMKLAWQNCYKQKDSEIIALENLIQKDVQRTDRSVKFFNDKEKSTTQKLLNILMTYSVYHPEPGYVQGMNDMVAPILYVVRDEPLAYACFCALMLHMNSIFHPNGITMNRRLNLLKKTIRAIDIDLWTKIEQCDVGNLMFAYRWLLLDCKREFPFKDVFRVFETVWASLPSDRFELDNDSLHIDREDFSQMSVCNQSRASILSSISNTISSSRSYSPVPEEAQSQHSSTDGGDSGYRDEHNPDTCDCNLRLQKSSEHSIYPTVPTSLNTTTCVPLQKWLTHFSSIDDEEIYSDMFTIFLCVALIEQNRSSIMQMSPTNTDDDDFIGSYFTRLVRQHDARHALQLARNYHRQYVVFQMRVKQLLLTEG